MAISPLANTQTGISRNDLMDQMQRTASEAMQFQTLASDIQHQQNVFNTLLHAKLEGMKSLSDLAKDSIQKANYN